MRSILILLISIIALAATAHGQTTRPDGSITTQPAAATQPSYAGAFRDLYKHLGDVYPNFQMKQIDWKKVGDELLPQADRIKTEREFGLLIEQLVARLQDSHAIIQPGSANPPEPDLPQWDPGITCLMDDKDRPVIYTVEKDSPADRAGVRPGMAVVSVNGVPAKQLITQTGELFTKWFGYSSDRVLEYDAVRAFPKQTKQGQRTILVLEKANGQQEGLALPADCGDRYLPRLPVPREGIDDSANVSWKRLDDGTGYIYVRRIQQGLEESLDQALTDLKGITGLIIDVRGNSGGGFDSETALRNFDLSPTNTAQPDRPRYTGPIAMLIDGRCISAGEGWTSWFVANKRARLFGTGTAGASAAKETYTLTNGMYQIVVPTKAYNGYLDRPIERRGLEPDVAVRCSAADLANGKDTVVETAQTWLESGAAK